MNFLATADLHLTDRSRDEYRWEFLDWFLALATRHDPEVIFILGDLTDAKDRHSARLVNRTIERLRKLGDVTNVFVLMGNHDYSDPECPFFGFLGGSGYVTFVSHFTTFGMPDANIAFVPHGQELTFPYTRGGKLCDLVLCHHMIRGAKLSAGYKTTEGRSPPRLKDGQLVLSGDVHIPQKVGALTYVGAPYPIDFGDLYKPRVLWGDTQTGELESIPVPTIKKAKVVLEDPEELTTAGYNKGDQLKIVLNLPRAEFASWEEHKARVLEIARGLGVQVFGVELKEKPRRQRVRLSDAPAPIRKTAAQLLIEYAGVRKVPDHILDVGLEVLQS